MLTLLVAALLAPQSTSLEPTGGWKVTRMDNMCIAARPFLDADGDEVMLYLNPSPVGEGLTIMVEGELGDRRLGNHDGGTLLNADGEIIYRVRMSTAEMASGRYITRIETSFEPELGAYEGDRTHYAHQPKPKSEKRREGLELRQEPDAEKTSLEGRNLTVRYDADVAHEFDITGVPAIRRTLDRCREAVLRDYGTSLTYNDRVEHDAFVTEIGYTADDYPSKMLRAMQGARMMTLLWIDTDGKVERCELLTGSGFEDFDKDICAVAKRSSHYEPAVDNSGESVPSLQAQPITFMISE